MAWLPTRVALQPNDLYVELREIAPAALQDPFMQETINRTQARQTYVQIPKHELGSAPANTAPAGLIFHVARCGSTLASQLLKLHEDVIVYAEPLPINELLAPPQKWSRKELVASLRSLGALFASHAGKRYVLKLTSWNTLYCDILAESFPKTPWALCIRDPLEVCVSLALSEPGWLRDKRLFQSVLGGPLSPTSEIHAARLFAAFCAAVARLDPARGMAIAYETMPASIWTRLAPHFDLPTSDALVQRMRGAAQTHSKSRIGQAAPFAPDADRKRAAASKQLRQAVDAYARPEFERLRSVLNW